MQSRQLQQNASLTRELPPEQVGQNMQCHTFFWGCRNAAGMLIGHTNLRVTKINKMHKVHVPKFQGLLFLRVPKRCRRADWALQAHRRSKHACKHSKMHVDQYWSMYSRQRSWKLCRDVFNSSIVHSEEKRGFTTCYGQGPREAFHICLLEVINCVERGYDKLCVWEMLILVRRTCIKVVIYIRYGMTSIVTMAISP